MQPPVSQVIIDLGVAELKVRPVLIMAASVASIAVGIFSGYCLSGVPGFGTCNRSFSHCGPGVFPSGGAWWPLEVNIH